jgi:membrane protein DedA with SNARE-associated domain
LPKSRWQEISNWFAKCRLIAERDSGLFAPVSCWRNFYANPCSISLEWRILTMDVAGLIEHYGYLAVAVGTFLEGETALVVAGFAAYRGYLALPNVMLVAALASFLGDQLVFHMGRRYGPALLARFPSVQPRAERVKELLRRHHLPLILSIRFLYGLRTAGLIVLGMSGVSAFRFLALNFISAITWATVIASVGYFFGRAVERLLENSGAYQLWILGGMLLCGSLYLLYCRRARSTAVDK